MQAEYATDLVFKNQDTLQAIYPHLIETFTHALKPADIVTILGRKLNGNHKGEMGIHEKYIFSLSGLQESIFGANKRYIKVISSNATPEVGIEKLHHLAETKTKNNHC